MPIELREHMGQGRLLEVAPAALAASMVSKTSAQAEEVLFTMRTQAEASRAGRELVKKMKSRGWKLQVWENRGWHFSIANKGVTIYPLTGFEGSSYHLLCNNDGDDKRGSGEVYWTSNGDDSCRDPNKLLERQLKLVQKFTDKTVATCEHLIKLVRETKGKRA